MGPISWLKVLFGVIGFQAIMRALEGLVDFVAFLVETLWQKLPNIN